MEAHRCRLTRWLMLGAGALGQPRGMVWGRRREEGTQYQRGVGRAGKAGVHSPIHWRRSHVYLVLRIFRRQIRLSQAETEGFPEDAR